MNDKLQFIRDKCIAANPHLHRGLGGDQHIWRSIPEDPAVTHITRLRLADVLLAFPDEPTAFWLYSDEAAFDFNNIKSMDGKRIIWNLRADDLEKQSPETIEFLYSLLS